MKSIHDPRYKELVEKLIRLREGLDVTQTQLASKLNKPQSYVAKIENLDRRLDVVEIADWLGALDCAPHSFMATVNWWGR